MVDSLVQRDMAGLGFTPASLPFEQPAAGSVDGLPARRARLAIVSTYHELCGIAAYTRTLERQLADVFDVTVFDLDQYLLRSTHPRVRKLGDRHIKQICREIATFDAVNLQFEHGIFGRLTKDIYRRFTWLVGAAPRISVTFHTVYPWAVFERGEYLREMLRLNFGKAYALRRRFHRSHQLSVGITRYLRRKQRLKDVAVIVHNRRDCRDMKHVHAIRRVYDHPLAFIGAAEAEAIRVTAARGRFAQLDPLPTKATLVGVFGFLGPYKGFETMIRAMQHLPENHHLLVFGAVHPNEIAPHRTIDPYLSSLLAEAYVDTTIPERLSAAAGGGSPALTVTIDRQLKELLVEHPKDLSARVHFMGAMEDEDFLAAMAICDVTVFPYMEVRQSSSGPIAQALELGCRIIASRTHAFLEYGRYHRNRIEYFDIGNHLELAQRILVRPQFDTRWRRPDFDVESNKAVYRAANSDAPPMAAKTVEPRRALRPANYRSSGD